MITTIKDSLISTRLRRHHFFIILLVGICVRLLMWGWVTSFDMLPTGDELGYYRRAEAYARILSDISAGYPIFPGALDSAYGAGRWPPLHPLLMGIAIHLTNVTEDQAIRSVARLAVTIQSILTLIVLYSMTRYLFDKNVASVASFIYIFHPEFILYGMRLMSETTFALFILLSLYTFIRVLDSATTKSRMVWSIACTFSLGLASLTRGTALPLFVIFPIALWLTVRNRRALVFSFSIVAMALAMTSPWLYWLYQEENRMIPLSTSGTLNIYLFNNEFFDINHAYEQNPSHVRDRAYDYLREYAQEKNISVYAASSNLALTGILSDPLLFVRRSLDRFVQFWVVDSSLVQMLVRVRFPPVPGNFLIISTSFVLIIHTITFAAIFRGLAMRSTNHKWLILAVVGGMLSLSLISFSAPRMHFASLLLLLPFAGYGMVNGNSLSSVKRAFVSIGIVFIFVSSLLSQLPHLHSQRPSAYYHDLYTTLDRWLGVSTPLTDTFEMVAWAPDVAEPITVRIDTNGYQFANGKTQTIWDPQDDQTFEFSTVGHSPVGNLQLHLETKTTGKSMSVLLEPLNAQAWKSWTPTGLPDVDFQWDAKG